MRVSYVGNFGVSHSTETHVAQALEALDVDVVREQENLADWDSLADKVTGSDFVLWTTTFDYAPPSTFSAQRGFLADCPVPVVGFHLDRWFGLNREHRVVESPFFASTLVVTADGGHEAEFAEAGVNHRWMPPGVSEFECVGGTFRHDLASPVAFVGSWQGGYHREWAHRQQLVTFLQRNYKSTCAFYPKRGEHAVRGEPLRDLYASVGVLVGDSCLAGNVANYWSDRIPESLGRGGFLLHPTVDGLEEHYRDGEHLRTWRAFDWEALRYLIDYYVAHPDEAQAIAEKGRQHVLETATYTVRMRELIDLLRAEGLL